MRYRVYYAVNPTFQEGPFDLNDLRQTHKMVAVVSAPNLEELFHHMQGDNWSPNGEARHLIEDLGLRHTSMSVGDVAVDDNNVAHLVVTFGFKKLGNIG
jgi:hypothetical protein